MTPVLCESLSWCDLSEKAETVRLLQSAESHECLHFTSVGPFDSFSLDNVTGS